MKLRSIAQKLLDQLKTAAKAAEPLAKLLADDADLRQEIALDYLMRLPPKRPSELRSRRREGPHRRSGMPTAAQKLAAVRVEKAVAAESIFNMKLRGAGPLGDVHIHELRAIAEKSAHIGASFLQRGFIDVVEMFLCLMLTKHCVSSDPFARVRDVIKPKVADEIYTRAKLSAAEALRDRSAQIAKDLIAAAQRGDEPREISP
jgi:hypothetical protein